MQAGTQWFAAKTTDGRLVGIATAYINPDNTCNVDGFIHKRFNDSYEVLINAAIDWGTRQHALQFTTRLSVEDEEKRANFEELGFRTQALDGTFTIGDRQVDAALTMLLQPPRIPRTPRHSRARREPSHSRGKKGAGHHSPGLRHQRNPRFRHTQMA